ncbi:MAG: methyltransferase domain-containing protein, partial [Patescibacteria group bacterium]
MSLVSLFTPETIKTYHSDFNGGIKLIRFAADLRLDVGGLTQSGNVMVGIFDIGLKHLLPKGYRPESVLLLGLGGGSVIKYLRRRYPRARLTAVEIDSVMIEIARKHFHIDSVKNLKIVNQDAMAFIKKAKEHYSLILVDCFRGYETPVGFDDVAVLVKMKSLGDHLLINRLYWDDFKLKTDDFVAKISPHFQIKSV